MGDLGKNLKGMSESDLIRKAIVDNFSNSGRKRTKESSSKDIAGYDKKNSSSLCHSDAAWSKPPRPSKPSLKWPHSGRLNGSSLSSKYSISSPIESSRATVYSAGLANSCSFRLPKFSSGSKTMNRSNCNVTSFMLDSPSEASSSTSIADLVASIGRKSGGNHFSADVTKPPDCTFGSCSILRNKVQRDPSPSILKMRSSSPQCTSYRPLSCSFDLDDDDPKLKSTLSVGSTRPYSSMHDSGGGVSNGIGSSCRLNGRKSSSTSKGFRSSTSDRSTLLKECCDLLRKIGDISSMADKDRTAENGDKLFPSYRKLIGKKTRKSDGHRKSSKHYLSKSSNGKLNGNSNGKSSSLGYKGGACKTSLKRPQNGCCHHNECDRKVKVKAKNTVSHCDSLSLDSLCAMASHSSSSTTTTASSSSTSTSSTCYGVSNGKAIDAYRNLCQFDDEDSDTLTENSNGGDSICARLASKVDDDDDDDDYFGGGGGGGRRVQTSSREKNGSFDSGDSAVKPYILKCPKKLDSISDCCITDIVQDNGCDEEDEEDDDDACELVCPGTEEWFPVAPELQHAVARMAMKSLQSGDNVHQDLSRLKDANILPPDFSIPGEDKDQSGISSGSGLGSGLSCGSTSAMCTLSSKDSLSASPSQLRLAAEKLVEHIICRASKMESAKGGTPDLSECDKYLDELAKKLSIMVQKMSSSSLAKGSSSRSSSSGGSSSEGSSDESSPASSSSRSSRSSSGGGKGKKKKHKKNASSNNSSLVSKRHLPTISSNGRLVLRCLAQLQKNMAALDEAKKVVDHCRTAALWMETAGRPPRPATRRNANNSQGDQAPENSAASTQKTGDKTENRENNEAADQGDTSDADDDDDDGGGDYETTTTNLDDEMPPTMLLETPEEKKEPQQQPQQQQPKQQPQQQQPKQQPQQQQQPKQQSQQQQQPKQQPQQQQQPKQQQQQQQQQQRQPQQQKPSPPSEITPRRGSTDREVLTEVERRLEDSASLADDPSLKTFVSDVVYGLYSTVRRKLELMLKRQAEAASPGSLAMPVDQLLKNADDEIREAVLPVVIEHIAWIVRLDAQHSVKPGDQEAIVRALAAEFVDTIVTNAVLKINSHSTHARRPVTRVFVVESNDPRLPGKKMSSPAAAAAAAETKRQQAGAIRKSRY